MGWDCTSGLWPALIGALGAATGPQALAAALVDRAVEALVVIVVGLGAMWQLRRNR